MYLEVGSMKSANLSAVICEYAVLVSLPTMTPRWERNTLAGKSVAAEHEFSQYSIVTPSVVPYIHDKMWDCDMSADKIPDAVYRDFVKVESRETDVCGGVIEQTGLEIFSSVSVYTVETGTAGIQP